jgi:hypothetical protein
MAVVPCLHHPPRRCGGRVAARRNVAGQAPQWQRRPGTWLARPAPAAATSALYGLAQPLVACRWAHQQVSLRPWIRFSSAPDLIMALELAVCLLGAENLAAVVIHYHGGSAPRLSGDDNATEVTHAIPVEGSWPAAPRIRRTRRSGDVWAMSGPVYSNGKEIGTLGAIRIVSNWLDDWTVVKTDPWQADDGERQDRLIRGFGKEAYRRLRDAHVAIIGCGGGASHVIRQLALPRRGRNDPRGRSRYQLPQPAYRSACPDAAVARSSTGCCGAEWETSASPRSKVMRRMVRSIDDRIRLIGIREFFPTPATVETFALMRRNRCLCRPPPRT